MLTEPSLLNSSTGCVGDDAAVCAVSSLASSGTGLDRMPSEACRRVVI